jgi:hypothetical protein
MGFALSKSFGALAGPFQVGGKLPFDKLRANEKACPFALSLSKGEFAPKLKYTRHWRFSVRCAISVVK